MFFFLFQPLLESDLCIWFNIKSLENLVFCGMEALRQPFLLFNLHFSAYCVAWRKTTLGKLLEVHISPPEAASGKCRRAFSCLGKASSSVQRVHTHCSRQLLCDREDHARKGEMRNGPLCTCVMLLLSEDAWGYRVSLVPSIQMQALCGCKHPPGSLSAIITCSTATLTSLNSRTPGSKHRQTKSYVVTLYNTKLHLYNSNVSAVEKKKKRRKRRMTKSRRKRRRTKSRRKRRRRKKRWRRNKRKRTEGGQEGGRDNHNRERIEQACVLAW